MIIDKDYFLMFVLLFTLYAVYKLLFLGQIVDVLSWAMKYKGQKLVIYAELNDMHRVPLATIKLIDDITKQQLTKMIESVMLSVKSTPYPMKFLVRNQQLIVNSVWYDNLQELSALGDPPIGLDEEPLDIRIYHASKIMKDGDVYNVKSITIQPKYSYDTKTITLWKNNKWGVHMQMFSNIVFALVAFLISFLVSGMLIIKLS
jgi:hypothetical protein